MSLRDLGAITLFVEDLEATRRFYRDVFGLEPVNEDDVSTAFGFGNTIINVLQIGSAGDLVEPAAVGARDAGARAMLTTWVENADATCADLAERGVTLLNGPIDRPWGPRTAAFADPAGNVWEVAQTLRTPGS